MSKPTTRGRRPRKVSADLLTPAELVERWRGAVTEKTLRNWRAMDPPRGPAVTRLGVRVYYRLADVKRYERSPPAARRRRA